jgi:hypothetical protein
MRLALAERFGGRRQVVFVDRPGMGFSARGGKEGASPAYQAGFAMFWTGWASRLRSSSRIPGPVPWR